MTKPVVGVIGNAHVVNDRHNVQLVGQRNLSAIAEVAGALPLMFAGTLDITDIDALLSAVDGILLTGARANVHPARFGVEPDPRHEPYDHDRDAMALTLIEACVARGVPLFGICRGFQEMNVAFGGSLHPEIRDLPGRMNHRMPRLENGEVHPDPLVVFADRHEVRLAAEGFFARLSRLRSDPREFPARPGNSRTWRADRRRGRGGGWHDRGDSRCRCALFCARCAVARRIRPAVQPDQSRLVPGVRHRSAGSSPGPLRRAPRAWLSAGRKGGGVAIRANAKPSTGDFRPMARSRRRAGRREETKNGSTNAVRQNMGSSCHRRSGRRLRAAACQPPSDA